MPTKFLLPLLLFLINFSLTAQDKKLIWGISSSLDFNSYSPVKNIGPIEYKGKLNYSLGLVLKYELRERFILSAKSVYSTKNYKIRLSNYNPIGGSDPILVYNEEALYSNSFIDFTIEGAYVIGSSKNLDVLSVFGFVNSFLLSYKNEEIWDNDRTDYKTYNDYILSSKIGIGILMKGNKLGIYVEPQIRFYLMDVHTTEDLKNPLHLGIELQVLKL